MAARLGAESRQRIAALGRAVGRNALIGGSTSRDVTDRPPLRQSVARLQTTLLGVVVLLLPVAVPDVSPDVFRGLGILLALAGTDFVGFALTR